MVLKPFSMLTALLLAFSAAAQDAREIVKKADDKVRGKTSLAEMTIATVRPKWTRSMDIKAWSMGSEPMFIYV